MIYDGVCSLNLSKNFSKVDSRRDEAFLAQLRAGHCLELSHYKTGSTVTVSVVDEFNGREILCSCICGTELRYNTQHSKEKYKHRYFL